MKPGFCALCTDETTALVQRPLGRNYAPVWSCADCDEEPATERRDTDRGYYVPERQRIGNQLDAFSAAANRVAGPSPFRAAGSVIMNRATPGFLLVRVGRRDPDGNSRDYREAEQTLRGEPWYAEMRYLGADEKYHLFERPDAELAARVRSEPNTDPLATLEQFRVAGGGR